MGEQKAGDEQAEELLEPMDEQKAEEEQEAAKQDKWG